MPRRPLSSLTSVATALLLAATTLVALPVALLSPASGHEVTDPEFRVLVFSRTTGFRHDSIPAGQQALHELGDAEGFAVDATEDAAAFTDANLARYDAVVFLSTTGDVLGPQQEAAFERYIRAGGGYMGIHAASDTEYEWPFYGRLVGAYFDSHPHVQQADVVVEDAAHPAAASLPARWTRTDEWYNFKSPADGPTNPTLARDYSPRADVHVVASLDEATYTELDDDVDAIADDHPIAWCQDVAGGRSFYTGGGHTVESYADPLFRQHLLGGLRTAAGVEGADCSPPASTTPPADSSFEQITLAYGPANAGESIGLAVLPDGRALHTSRDGRVFLSEEGAGTTVAAQIPVYKHDEEGLQGIAVPPDFATSRWVYVMYAPHLDTPADNPATPGVNEGDAPTEGEPADFEPYRGETWVSRFRLGDDDQLDLGSEQVVLRIEADRGLCCHVGGDLLFDEDGNLLVSTGDDTNPFESDGYTPIDERPTRNPSFDAQRTAGNTNDLRGKVLRIHPEPDGSYTIPDGNLFGPGGTYPDADPALARPEIFAMGFRNPFRMGLDPATGWLYVGEYGPDAAAADDARGPGGLVEVLQIREPGNYGWPYCSGPNLAYRDYDFATGQSGPAFDCDAPVNDSPHNTGLRELPPAEEPWLWYDGGTVHYDGKQTDEFGSGSESPMAGPVYRYDPTLESDVKLPPYFDGHFFLGEWGRGWIKEIAVGDAGEPAAVQPFFDSGTIAAPMDFEFGPDGSLYVLDYGSASYGGMYAGGSPDAALYKINHVEGGRAPIARASGSPTSGTAPLTVSFSSEGTRDPDGDPLSYAWDFDGDGTTDSAEPHPTHVYEEDGSHVARLEVSDGTGKTAAATVDVVVGNDRPEVRILAPADGGVFDYGDRLSFRVRVTDPQDGEVDCDRVQVQTALGHNEHVHGDQTFTGCTGTLTVPPAWEPETQSSFFLVTASYTDDGAAGAPSLTGAASAILQPRRKQAEHFAAQSGVRVVDAADPSGGGGKAIGEIEDGDHVTYRPVDLAGIEALDLRVASALLGGTVEVRADGPDGPLLGTATVPRTGGDDTWTTVRAEVTDPGGTHDLVLVFRNPLLPPNPVAPQSMFRVNYLTFVGTGLDSPPTVEADASPRSGTAPLTVDLVGTATDPEGSELTYEWTPGDGTGALAGARQRHTYTEPGEYDAVLTVTDAAGNQERASVRITVEPAPDTTPPSVTRPRPRDGVRTGDRRPRIGARVLDDAGPLAAADVVLHLDGRRVAATYDAATGRLVHRPTKRLERGEHRVRVVAEDSAGNVAKRRWTFTVVK